ncbi:fused MFS/spermidine synthase [Desulfonema magnum]|uniref:Spermine/spermidine synthase domain-containing protein n=1 Tax=Desulfonema magnum TaxID=45655 RepID=A0A975BVR6_9BACT|nr:fused MFS/spermidine synthase [Desulfonema magnum]QTA92402.1 Spermine/spermidine synthase domain-containing protein [Desulfonema magnum]
MIKKNVFNVRPGFPVLISVLVYTVVFITGLTGLVYQVAWQKYLGRLLGSDTIATATILAVFLGGLSLGYYICGRFTTQVRNQFKAYAVLEGIIGIWCLNFPMVFKVVESLTREWHFSPPPVMILQGFFCSVILMGIPTICMGGTIPFLTRGLSGHIGEATRIHASVYAVNTAGAFIGTLLAGFYLIPNHGLPVTVKGTAFLNLGAFLFFYFIPGKGQGARGEGEPALSNPQSQITNHKLQITNRKSPAILCAIAFLSGFYVMTLENVLIRISNLSFGSSSYSFSLIVSVFILSIAMGSYVVGRLKDIPRHLLFTNQLLITITLLIVYLSLDTWPYWAHLIRGSFPSDISAFSTYYLNVFAALALILILPIGLMGATVPIAFHEIKRDLKNVGKHSGILFSLNTIGNLVGSLVGGIFFYYYFNNARVFLCAALLAAISTFLATVEKIRNPKIRNQKSKLLSLALIITVLVFFIWAPFYDEDHFMVGTFTQKRLLSYSQDGPDDFFRKWNSKRDLKFYKDGPMATVAVTEHPYPPGSPTAQKSLSIVVNGKSDSSTIGDAYLLKLLAHLPALLAEKRENTMVVGLGTGVTAAELTLYPDIESIDVAEISPSVVEVLPYFREFTYDLHLNPKARILMGDAFRILKRSEKKWDIILSEPSNPWVTGVDLLFTQEFYKLVREHLTENGILAQWIHTYFADPSMLGMIINTVSQEFDQCRVFMATPGDMILLASDKSFSLRDIRKAQETLNTNEAVRASLDKINFHTIETMLIREVWPPSYISDHFRDSGSGKTSFGIQTMDNPRLHYIAGKCFFTGKGIPNSYFFNSSSAPYFKDFLITKKYGNWAAFPFSKEKFDSLILSLKDKYLGYELPMTHALRLKAFLSDSEQYPLSEKQRQAYGIDDLIRHDGLKGNIRRFRSWIVPYPVKGTRNK